MSVLDLIQERFYKSQLTLEEFGGLVGMSYGAAYKIVNKKVKDVKLETAFNFCDALNIDPMDLYRAWKQEQVTHDNEAVTLNQMKRQSKTLGSDEKKELIKTLLEEL